MKKPHKPIPSPRDLKGTIRRQPVVFAVYLVLRLIVLGTLVSSIIRGEYESAFICLLVLALFMLPFFIQQNFGIELPSTLEIIILLFIFAAEILGELECYFITYPHWDSMLHTTTGFLCAATGFALIDILNRNSRIKFELSPIYVALAAFCFSMTVGVLWEFFEFGMDRLFHMDMQKDTVVQSITSVCWTPPTATFPSPSTTSTPWPSTDRTWGLTGIWTSGCTTPWRTCSSILSAQWCSAPSGTSTSSTAARAGWPGRSFPPSQNRRMPPRSCRTRKKRRIHRRKRKQETPERASLFFFSRCGLWFPYFARDRDTIFSQSS